MMKAAPKCKNTEKGREGGYDTHYYPHTQNDRPWTKAHPQTGVVVKMQQWQGFNSKALYGPTVVNDFLTILPFDWVLGGLWRDG